jgi:hypothetical protein
MLPHACRDMGKNSCPEASLAHVYRSPAARQTAGKPAR